VNRVFVALVPDFFKPATHKGRVFHARIVQLRRFNLMQLFRKILIANRGEIALRIVRTCREMGIAPVAVYANDDLHSPHVRAADEAISIGESYRDSERILEAAKLAGANAIHPGYGFLAEDADFAQACENAGFVFIGPRPQVIRTMGLKNAAREIAAACGVPVVPAFQSHDEMDFPVLIKASAGGGGRGMRLVTHRKQLVEALESARIEAERLFGDGSLLIEKFIEGARHVEVQIFGDLHGNLIHLFERDCSIQRRYQKVIEESPCPALGELLRNKICDAALQIGRAAGYTNAGTVEFLLAPSGQFYFIEVNPRIQVEHPVTELVTGLDIVRLQIEVAEGRPLTVQPVLQGHAIEARLYAEDPSNDFLPSPGTIQTWSPPTGVRVDSAIEAGQVIGTSYDPLLAKIIAHGPDRETACRKLVYALQSTRISGVRTNRDYLMQQLAPALTPQTLEDSWFEAAAALYLEQTAPRLLRGVPPNFRNNPFRNPSIKLALEGEVRTIEWRRLDRQQYEVNGTRLEMLDCAPGSITIAIAGIGRTFTVDQSGEDIWIHSSAGERTFRKLPRHPRPATSASRDAANSPIPGQVLRILVRVGQLVNTGESLVVLEAMKMEQTIRTTINGVVQSILVEPGQRVAPGQRLIEIRALEQAE
jgi:propionyl-CoA carboxylase alpha chain